jgi:hypothetical protein
MPADPDLPHPRANWPVRVIRRGEEEAVDEPATTPEQRLAMMWELATQAWAMAGIPLPDYDRAHTPVSIRKRDEVEE